MRSQCCGKRISPTVQLNSRPVRKIELYTNVCNILKNDLAKTQNKFHPEKLT